MQPQIGDGASRYAQAQDSSLRCPAPRPDRQSTQWHSTAAAEGPAGRAHAFNQSNSHPGEAQPGMSSGTTAQEPLQEEGSGYMSTESDSDTGATEKSKVRKQIKSKMACPVSNQFAK